MDIQVTLSKSKKKRDERLLVGRFVDLEYLVSLLNGAWEDLSYRLETDKSKRGILYFVEDPAESKEALVATLFKDGESLYAENLMGHRLIMDAYHRYVEDFGEIPTDK